MIKKKERGVGGAIEISSHPSTQLPQIIKALES